MKIVKNDIEKLLAEANYTCMNKFSDNQLNGYYNYWHFLQEYEEKLRTKQNLSLETILYSKYYWFSRLAERYHEIFGVDAGVDQQQFMIMEELEQRLNNVDWNFTEMLYNGNK